MKESIFEQQKAFMVKAEQLVAQDYNCNNPEFELWRKLILEEASELICAISMHNIVDIADGCIDLIYVVTGLMNNLGIPAQECWNEIHKSNMTKVVNGVTKREDGKIMKPETYRAPSLEPILFKE